MKNAFFLLFALFLPSICEAASYSIRAEYSVGMGIPVPNEEGKFEEIIYTRQDIRSKEKCENTVKNPRQSRRLEYVNRSMRVEIHAT